MFLSNLQLLNFRNYEDVNLRFCNGLNCLTGYNGTGKTNLLDAIHYLSMTKSFAHSSDAQSVKHGTSGMMIRGEVVSQSGSDLFLCALKSGQKKIFKVNETEYERMSQHIGVLPVVVIAPGDVEMAVGAGESRRRFLDTIISQYDKLYLHHLIRYMETLSQRNSLLKQFAHNGFVDWSLMSIYDHQLDESCNLITQARKAFVDDFNPYFSKFYAHLSSGLESPSITYESNLEGKTMMDRLLESRSKDLDLQFTSAGCHRDDLEFLINGMAIKKFASQGQLKTFLCAIRLAQFEILRLRSGKVPLLLLDDVFDRLDQNRVKQLLHLVCHPPFGQVFLTHTDDERLISYLHDLNREFIIFEVVNQQINVKHLNS
ncbi:MAG: DNA replication/repair protein RecF [Bacteroidia bacterium]